LTWKSARSLRVLGRHGRPARPARPAVGSSDGPRRSRGPGSPQGTMMSGPVPARPGPARSSPVPVRPPVAPQGRRGGGGRLGAGALSILVRWSALHTITQQKNVHCNTDSDGYIWIDPAQLKLAAAKRTLPPSLSYAGVLPGLLPSPDAPIPIAAAPPSPEKPNQTKPLISQMTPKPSSFPSPLSPTIVPSHTPQCGLPGQGVLAIFRFEAFELLCQLSVGFQVESAAW
jgi:hypothetical protein